MCVYVCVWGIIVIYIYMYVCMYKLVDITNVWPDQFFDDGVECGFAHRVRKTAQRIVAFLVLAQVALVLEALPAGGTLEALLLCSAMFDVMLSCVLAQAKGRGKSDATLGALEAPLLGWRVALTLVALQMILALERGGAGGARKISLTRVTGPNVLLEQLVLHERLVAQGAREALGVRAMRRQLVVPQSAGREALGADRTAQSGALVSAEVRVQVRLGLERLGA